MRAIFLRALEANDKPTALLSAIHDAASAIGVQRFDLEVATFTTVPRSPFAYWVSDRTRRLFTDLSQFESDGRTARVGIQTSDDFRFVRVWWETDQTALGHRWFDFAKGGLYSPFYVDQHRVVNWNSDGREMKAWAGSLYGNSHWSRILKNTDSFFRPGLTWPLRGLRFSAQVVPRGCIFDVAGKMAFFPDDLPLPWLAVFNSRIFDHLMGLSAGTFSGVQYQAGLVREVPVPDIGTVDEVALSKLAWRAWSLKRNIDTCIETSHAHVLPAFLQVEGMSLATRVEVWGAHVSGAKTELTVVQSEIDERCWGLYGLGQADWVSLGNGPSPAATVQNAADSDGDDRDQEGEAVREDGRVALAAELVSWCVGVVFGRFDVRLATGERAAPPEPGPFDPLPVCSPGMLAGEDGLPVDTPPGGYPIVWPVDGLLVDDPGHPRDLTSAVREVFDVVFGADADALWVEAAELVDPRGRDIRRWLAKSFFPEHVKRYSKSRRKAPIYWQLGTPSGSYSVWLYAHRVGRDSLYQVLNDLVAPKLQAEERKLTALRQEAGPNPTAGQRKELAAQETLVEELRVLRDEVARVAPLWSPDLNDGVVIVMAPVWRLVPQHKPWQKELKTHWYALQAGKYDWAQLAMHLWPERVVPKCATDRSVAIAHDLEEVFWEQDADGKWKTRNLAQAEIDRLMAARTSPAVKDALTSLTAASEPSTSRRSLRGVAA